MEQALRDVFVAAGRRNTQRAAQNPGPAGDLAREFLAEVYGATYLVAKGRYTDSGMRAFSVPRPEPPALPDPPITYKPMPYDEWLDAQAVRRHKPRQLRTVPMIIGGVVYRIPVELVEYMKNGLPGGET